MPHGLLADAVLAIHAAFIAFVGVGALAVLRWLWLAWLHVPAVAWGVWITTSGGICPLTPLENSLRRAAGQEGYQGGFIEHYLQAIIYPAGLTRELQIGLGTAAALLNIAVYVVLWRRRRSGARR